MSNSSISRMLKLQTRLRASRDRFYVMSGIFLLATIGILFNIVNGIVLGDALLADSKQTFMLLLACIAGCYFSYRAGKRCSDQMEGESRRWKQRVKVE